MRYIEDIQVGDTAYLERHITDDDIRAFVALSGDDNPIHVDDAYAEASLFGKRIVHGALMGCIVSGLMGTKLPGPGSAILTTASRFKSPVFVGDLVRATVTVKKVKPGMQIVAMDVAVEVIDGDTPRTAVVSDVTLFVPSRGSAE